jgi:hypothetical protein
MSVWQVGRSPPNGQSPDQVVRTIAVRNGCLQYVDSRDVKGIADGADVTTWPARIGADPTQPSGGLKPSYNSQGPFVEFDAVGESLPTPAVNLSSSPVLSYVLAAYTRGAGGRIVWEHGNPYYLSNGTICLFSGGLPGIGTGSASAGSITNRTAAYARSGVSVIGAAFDRATNTDTIAMYHIDGTAGISATPSDSGAAAV